MEINKNIHINSKKTCTVHNKLQSYVNMELSPEEENYVDDQLDACGEGCYCEEIIEGLQFAKMAEKLSQKNPELKEGLNQELLFERIEPFIQISQEKSQSPKIIPLSRRPIFWVAASLLVLLVSWFLLSNLGNQNLDPKIAQPKDSLKSEPSITEKKPERQTPKQEKEEQESPQQENQENTPKPTPSIQKPRPKVDMLAFVPNPDLESQVSGEKQNRGLTDVKAIRPKNLQNFTEELDLEWQDGGVDELSIEITNNQNQPVKSFDISTDETKTTIDVSTWKPGLYYWVILYQGYEPVHTGKFYVKKPG